jgi:hypothetical protein
VRGTEGKGCRSQVFTQHRPGELQGKGLMAPDFFREKAVGDVTRARSGKQRIELKERNEEMRPIRHQRKRAIRCNDRVPVRRKETLYG